MIVIRLVIPNSGQAISSACTLAFEMQMFWRDELLAGLQNFAWHVQITVR
jgi:hypothetical protein